ncbi:MAG: metallophosphoesterase, partial [Bacteroidia bacterium]|nr:metallophosphoesterase [Bacteroidia bacterium]
MMGIWGWLWLQQIFAVGDAGALTEKQVRLYSLFWQKHADSGDVLIWLGDNVYPRGLTATTRAQRRWQRLLRVSRQFPGTVWLTPGNHDWKADTQGILRQAAALPLFPPPSEPFSLLQKGVWTFLFLDSERYIRTQGKGFPWGAIDSLWLRYARLVVVLHHPPR